MHLNPGEYDTHIAFVVVLPLYSHLPRPLRMSSPQKQNNRGETSFSSPQKKRDKNINLSSALSILLLPFLLRLFFLCHRFSCLSLSPPTYLLLHYPKPCTILSILSTVNVFLFDQSFILLSRRSSCPPFKLSVVLSPLHCSTVTFP